MKVSNFSNLMSVFNGHANPLLKSKKVKLLHQYQRWTAYLGSIHNFV